MSGEQVLVTGASGYIASHVVQQLQTAGYKVRGTVRSLKNEKKVDPIRKLCPDAAHELELVEADLNDADSWLAAVQGCKYVMHIASPFTSEAPKHEDELIKPAVDGTLNVLKAVKAAKCVKRVVLTSSIVSVCGDVGKADKVYSEEDWTDVKTAGAYSKSKTLAEQAAWDFIKEITEEEEKFELAVINPSFVLGPVLINTLTTSMEVPKRMLNREMPLLPRVNFGMIDVRDVAAAHVAAMTLPEAAGKRHILCAGNMWMKEIAQIYHSEFKGQGYNPPLSEAPYWMLWVYGRFDKTVKMILPTIGKMTKFDSSRMTSVLGIEPRPLKDTFIDMAYSMIEMGLIKKTAKYRGPGGKKQDDAATESGAQGDTSGDQAAGAAAPAENGPEEGEDKGDKGGESTTETPKPSPENPKAESSEKAAEDNETKGEEKE